MKTNIKTITKRIVPMFLMMLTVSLVCISAPAQAAFQYDFSSNSEGWRFMGLYDGSGLTPLNNFMIAKNPWTGIDGNNGAILLGQEGFTTQSPTGNAWVHGDLNSPDLGYRPKSRFIGLSYDITGSHMSSTARVYVQAVIVVRQPNEISDRLYRSDSLQVPLADNGAWDTHTLSLMLPAGTIVKKINLRIYFETGSLYSGWIMVDNVFLN